MISVITVCYNSSKTIEKTFQCMLHQTYTNYEYVVVDGKSTDGTLDVIKEYLPKFNGRMKYISEPDNGIYDAMNKGIKMCSGDLIGILNSDDWYEDNTLDLVATNRVGDKYEVIYGMQRTIKNGKEYDVVIKRHEFLTEKMITHPTCFVTKKTYDDLGVFSMYYKSSADYELMLRFWLSGKVTFTPVYAVLSNFVLGGMSSSNTGVIETAKLKYKLGLISRKKYYIAVIKGRLSDLIGNT